MSYDDLKQPCNQCPFRVNCIPGWLGPWSPEALLESLVHEPFPCHLTVTLTEKEYKGCAGAGLFFNNILEISRHPDTSKHQKVLDKSSDDIFTSKQRFLAHHKKWRKK